MAECIANKLTELDVPAYSWFRMPKRGRNSAIAREVNQFGVSEEFLEKAWIVKTDCSVKIYEEETTEFCDDSDNDPFTYVAIEIASPMSYK